MAENNGKIVTPLFRLSFPSLWEPTAAKGSDKKKYSLTMLFPKNADLSTLRKLAVDAITAASWGGADRKKWPANLRNFDLRTHIADAGRTGWPFRNGDNQDYDGYQDMVSVVASNEHQKPAIVGRDRNPIVDQADVYPGCYGHAVITAYAWDHPTGGKGVSFSLLAFMKVKDGEPFTRRYDPDDFAGINYDDVSDSQDSYTDDDIPF